MRVKHGAQMSDLCISDSIHEQSSTNNMNAVVITLLNKNFMLCVSHDAIALYEFLNLTIAGEY